MAEYPFVECGEHGDQKAYIICDHVVHGSYPKHVIEIQEGDMGEILCWQCSVSKPPLETLSCVCELHAAIYLKRRMQ